MNVIEAIKSEKPIKVSNSLVKGESKFTHGEALLNYIHLHVDRNSLPLYLAAEYEEVETYYKITGEEIEELVKLIRRKMSERHLSNQR